MGKRWAIFVGLLLWAAGVGQAQAVYSASGPTRSLWAGVELSDYSAGFPRGSTTRLAGPGFFANYNFTHALGVEAHLRLLNYGGWQQESARSVLVGPRYTFLHRSRLRPYVSFEVGTVTMHYPFALGTGTMLALAPGGGVDYHLARRWELKLAGSMEMLRNSPDFSNQPHYGMKPTGGSVGVAYRIF